MSKHKERDVPIVDAVFENGNISTIFIENKDIKRAEELLHTAGIGTYVLDDVPFGVIGKPFMTLDEVECYLGEK